MVMSFNIKPGTSAEELSERRKLAYALMQEGGSGAPVGHWLQGANRLAQALIGGYDLYNTEEAGRKEKADASNLLGEALGLGAGGSSPSFTPGAQVSSMPPQGATAPQQVMSPARGAAAAAGRPMPTQAMPAASGDVAAFIKAQEGYTPAAAWDRRQYSSGYGTKAQPGEVIDQAEAERRLQAEIAPIDAWIGQNVKVPLTPQQKAGLTSFAYNLGIDDLQKLLPDINSGNWARVAQRMPSFNKAINNKTGQLEVVDGLTSRRQREAALVLGAPGQVPAAPAAPQGAPAAAGGAPAAARSPLGIDPATARIIQKLSMNERTAPIAMKLLESAMTPQNKVGRYRPSKQGIVDTVTGQIVPGTEQSGTDSAEYGTSPQYYRDADGKLRIGQLSKAGGMKPVDLPAGAEILPGVDYKDTGTAFVGFDRRTGQAVQSVPKDVAGEAREKEVGKGIGERTIAKPATNANMRSSISGLTRLAQEARSLKDMSGVESMTGVLQGSGYVPTIYQTTADAEAKLNTLKSQIAFNVLQAMRDASKTGGALGSVAVEELRMLQNNLASLETQQGTPAFKANLDRVAEYAEGAIERLRAGYRDTYGQAFEDAPAQDPDQPTPVRTLRYNRDTGKFE